MSLKAELALREVVVLKPELYREPIPARLAAPAGAAGAPDRNPAALGLMSPRPEPVKLVALVAKAAQFPEPETVRPAAVAGLHGHQDLKIPVPEISSLRPETVLPELVLQKPEAFPEQ